MSKLKRKCRQNCNENENKNTTKTETTTKTKNKQKCQRKTKTETKSHCSTPHMCSALAVLDQTVSALFRISALKCDILRPTFQGHSRSSEPTRIDRLPM